MSEKAEPSGDGLAEAIEIDLKAGHRERVRERFKKDGGETFSDTDLLEAFNKELVAFLGTPEHLALVTPFGFGKDYLPVKTTAELCAGQ